MTRNYWNGPKEVMGVATIIDVAKRAGVSRSTVSLVINKSPLVKEDTRQLVERVIAQMGYVPNCNARGLSAKATNNLGVIIMQYHPQISTRISYDNDQRVGLCNYNITNGIMAALAATNYGVVTEKFCSIAAPDELPRIIREKRVDGAFIVGTPYSPQLIENMKKTGIPFAMLGVSVYEESVDSIWSDPEEGTELALRELLRTGHRKICLLNAPRNLSSHMRRSEAYRKCMEEFRLPYQPDWDIDAVDNDGKSAYAAFAKFWEAGNRPDAIVGANGQIVIGAMNYLYKQGVRIPEDISVIAYEDSSLCGYCIPALTSVNIRKEDMGFQAAKCLMARIRDPEKEIEHHLTHPYMVYRDSVRAR